MRLKMKHLLPLCWGGMEEGSDLVLRRGGGGGLHPFHTVVEGRGMTSWFNTACAACGKRGKGGRGKRMRPWEILEEEEGSFVRRIYILNERP